MDTEAEGRERGQAPASSDEHPEKRKEKKEASSQLLLGTWAFTFGLGEKEFWAKWPVERLLHWPPDGDCATVHLQDS